MRYSIGSFAEARYDLVTDLVYSRDIDAFLYDPKMEKGFTYIYFILCEVAENNIEFNRIKIGIANDPYQRLYELQTGCPFELKFLYKFKIPTGIEFKSEKTLHRKFSKYKSRGEWFNYHPDIVNWIGFHESQLKIKYKDNKKVYKLRKASDKVDNKPNKRQPKIKKTFFEVCPKCFSEDIDIKASNSLKGIDYHLWCNNCHYIASRSYKKRINRI